MLKKVTVQWVDPTTYHGWQSVSDIKDFTPDTMESEGWLVESAKKFIKIALSKAVGHETYSDILVIPVGCLRYVKRRSVSEYKKRPRNKKKASG